MKIAFKMKTYNILSIDEFKTNIGNNSRLLGIDPGNKNIGFAICDENKKVATPYKIIKKGKFAILLDEINLIGINDNLSINDKKKEYIIYANDINYSAALFKMTIFNANIVLRLKLQLFKYIVYLF